jgi:hypothetical protein
MTDPPKLFAGAVVLAGFARLLLIPCDSLERDAELRSAYQEYRYCMGIDIFCLPASPCPQLNCMGDYLREVEEINARYTFLSTFEHGISYRTGDRTGTTFRLPDASHVAHARAYGAIVDETRR